MKLPERKVPSLGSSLCPFGDNTFFNGFCPRFWLDDAGGIIEWVDGHRRLRLLRQLNVCDEKDTV